MDSFLGSGGHSEREGPRFSNHRYTDHHVTRAAHKTETVRAYWAQGEVGVVITANSLNSPSREIPVSPFAPVSPHVARIVYCLIRFQEANIHNLGQLTPDENCFVLLDLSRLL